MKIRVLQITGGFRKGVSGGIASVLTNYCTAPAFESGFQIDYLALGYQPFEPYRETLTAKGSEIYSLGIRSDGTKRLVDIYNKLKNFLKKNKYHIVHVNSGAPPQVLAACMAARSANVKVIIAHSHNALAMTAKRKIVYPIVKKLIVGNSDYYFACSKMAAESMFPAKVLKNKEWIYIPNAIFAEKFSFDETVRTKYREEFGLSNDYVLGHIGRFNEQKNHEYLLRIFNSVLKKVKNAKLLLVGTGDLQGQIRKEAETLGIADKVIFTGQRKDANALLQAMDIFVFPSRWEGLPVTVVEAQAAGLKCLISDRITPEVRCSELIEYLSIDGEVDEWVDKIAESATKKFDRSNIIIGTDFDLNKSGDQLANYYRKYVSK